MSTALPHSITSTQRHLGRMFAVVLGLCALPYVIQTVRWWLANDAILVSFSLVMPIAASAGCWVRLRRPVSRTSEKSTNTSKRTLWLVLGAASVALAGLSRVFAEPLVGAAGLWLAAAAGWGLALPGRSTDDLLLPLMPLLFTAPLTWGLGGELEDVLQLTSAAIAELGVTLAGVEVVRDGIVLSTASINTVVDDTCSGVGTISSLMVFTLLLSMINRLTTPKAWLAVALTAPLGLVINGARVTWIAVLAETEGYAVATGNMHNIAGYVAFGVGYVLILAMVAWMGRQPRAARDVSIA